MSEQFEKIEINGLSLLKADPPRISEKHPILFIHGMSGGAWIWENYLKFFSTRGYTCYAMNLRGHLDSKPVPDIGKVKFQEFLEDVREVVAALGNPILMGHSMGGILVQKEAERLNPPAAVLITPVGPKGILIIKSFPLLLWIIRHHPKFLMGHPIVLSKKEVLKLHLNQMPPQQQDLVFSRFVPESGKALLNLVFPGIPVEASKIKCPMLVVGAAQDKTITTKVVWRISEKYNADFREYHKFAHMIHIEPGWEKVAQDIYLWLQENLRKES